MATLIPAFGSCSQKMMPGERRLAQRLEEKLDDDYLLWYDVPVGEKRLRPDFIILHPRRGLIVLEVKDWKLDTIRNVGLDQRVTILVDGREKKVKHPLEQARNYALAIANLLEKDSFLVHADGKYQGNLAFPYSYGVVLTNITRKQFEATEALQHSFSPNLVICQDEMYESVDAGEFQERLWNLCTYQFGEPLTPVQMDRIRWHLFPDVRIPRLLAVMDLKQEQIARSIGEGHRIIHGVAGSGKTLILAYRCEFLAQKTDKPILVLCFNVSLAAKLRAMLHEKGILDRIVVRHFHGWCKDLLWQYRIARPSYNQFGAAYPKELVQRVIRSVDAGKIPAGQYGAVLVDEGHDFEPEWLKLLVQMIDPETNSLLLLYDDAQSIYEKQQTKKFSFKSVGIQAQGRTTILKINYRNTQDILSLAYEFAKEAIAPGGEQDDDTPVIVQPESAGRRGPKPQLIRLPSFQRETEYLRDRVLGFRDRGFGWNEMAIVYRSKFMAEKICTQFQRANIPVEWVNRNSDSRNFDSAGQSIKLVTMHSSKGLEFPVVLVPGIGFMPTQAVDPVDEARLLYVAMTRAIDELVMTCDRESKFVQRVQSALANV